MNRNRVLLFFVLALIPVITVGCYVGVETSYHGGPPPHYGYSAGGYGYDAYYGYCAPAGYHDYFKQHTHHPKDYEC